MQQQLSRVGEVVVFSKAIKSFATDNKSATVIV